VDSQAAYKVVQVDSGAHSIHSLAYGETFHPVIGPAAEAEALYVRQLRLRDRLQQHAGEFVIWDVGLGAAANVLTVLRAARDIPCQLRVVSFDQTLEPLRFALNNVAHFDYFSEYEAMAIQLARGDAPLVHFQHRQQRVCWELHLADFPNLIRTPAAAAFPKPHAILFDAYSPAANPAMWTQPLFASVYHLLDPAQPCAVPTYSRSTLLRVTLLLAGFFVGRGHATGEKEETTLAANSLELISEPLDLRWLRRARVSSSAEPLWEPIYRQARLSTESWEKLCRHPQFQCEPGFK
jgi:tRNA U34 5-methylaminomethyl-2-thiouridine-forming methyltransferase MnmC